MFAEVSDCTVKSCFYNHDHVCTARGITIGSATPKCETWMFAEKSHSHKPSSALVGACHMENCSHNASCFCHAENDIEVGMIDAEAHCLTFEQKM